MFAEEKVKMKLSIHAIALALALTGAAVSAHYSPNSRQDAAISAAKLSAVPIPTCPPDDPNGCGIQR